MVYTHSNPRRTLITLFALSIILSIGYTLRSRFVTQAPVGINEITQNGVVALHASPSTVLVRPGQTKMMDISLISNSEKVTAVQLELNYNPTNLLISDFNHTSFMPVNIVEPRMQPEGQVFAVYGVEPSTGGLIVNNSIARYMIHARDPGTTTISFGQSTLASVISMDTNALKEVHSATIKILFPGDIDGNNIVNLLDYRIFVAEYGTTGNIGYSLADLDNKGQVDLFDYRIFVNNYGKDYR